MAKYSCELKEKIVKEYLCGKTSYQALVVKCRIKKSVLRLWVSSYKNYGDEGLVRSRNDRAYSIEFKLEAITRYETSERNYRQLVFRLGLMNPPMIVNRRRQYRERGIKRLLPHKRGRPVTKRNDHNRPPRTVKKSESIDTSMRETLENRTKELEAENRKLTIRKMFWEQLRGLEEEEAMNKRQRLPPNSENNPN